MHGLKTVVLAQLLLHECLTIKHMKHKSGEAFAACLSPNTAILALIRLQMTLTYKGQHVTPVSKAFSPQGSFSGL